MDMNVRIDFVRIGLVVVSEYCRGCRVDHKMGRARQ
jgi:hypothetical protein